jgi:large subunit ribosomal protein L9
MKLILLKDVAKIGLKGTVVEVPDGFALNKLIPKGLAQAATPESLKRIQNVTVKQKENQEHEASAFVELLKKMGETHIEVVVEANNEGKMFQALKAPAIVDAVVEATGITLHAEHIVMKVPIKSVGEHTIELVSGATHGTAVIHLIAKSK